MKVLTQDRIDFCVAQLDATEILLERAGHLDPKSQRAAFAKVDILHQQVDRTLQEIMAINLYNDGIEDEVIAIEEV